MERISWKPEERRGLVAGNASISGDVSPRGRLFQRIVWNPPCFEDGRNGMREGGESGFLITAGGKTKKDAELSWTVLERDYPRYRAKAQVLPGLSVEVCAFAPLAPGDTEPMFLPSLLVSLSFEGETAEEVAVTWAWKPTREMLEGSYSAPVCLQKEAGCFRAERGDAFLELSGGEMGGLGPCGRSGLFSVETSFRMQGKRRVQAMLGYFPKEHRFRIHAESTGSLCGRLRQEFPHLEEQVEEWILSLPQVGDEQILRYTRWYSQAAVMLTKSDVTGRVITMGYHELNQRDSFWTSFVHLSFWPKLEQAMLRESCLWQREDGKLPTTILPKYERETDVDINEYFCLRIARYFHWHRDLPYLRECWPHFCRSVEFLLTLDRDGDGLPEQAPPENPLCFWADWKDVKGIVGRKLAPHFVLLWLAVLQEGILLSQALESEKSEAWFRELFQRAKAQTELPVQEGGLWQGDHYTELWYDGREISSVLQDQTVGMAFGVVEEERAGAIWQALSRGENEGGIPETYPFREEMEYEPGVYHNGGIWPYLTFCDCMGRYRMGAWEDAERLIRKTGHYDLEVPGDFAPNEYLHGITLENCGFEIQGWSSALFGTLTHGAFTVERPDELSAVIHVNFPERDFATRLLLPEPVGTILVGRRDGVLFHSDPELEWASVQVTERPMDAGWE